MHCGTIRSIWLRWSAVLSTASSIILWKHASELSQLLTEYALGRLRRCVSYDMGEQRKIARSENCPLSKLSEFRVNRGQWRTQLPLKMTPVARKGALDPYQLFRTRIYVQESGRKFSDNSGSQGSQLQSPQWHSHTCTVLKISGFPGTIQLSARREQLSQGASFLLQSRPRRDVFMPPSKTRSSTEPSIHLEEALKQN